MERRALRSAPAEDGLQRRCEPYAGRHDRRPRPQRAHQRRVAACCSASRCWQASTAAASAALSLADALTATGLPDPGPVTTYGLPFVRAAGEIAAVVAVGSFLFAAFLVPPQHNGVLDADGYRALRLGTVAVGRVDGVRGAAGAADRLRCLRPAAARPPQSGRRSGRSPSLVDTAGAWRWTAFLAAVVTIAQHPGAALVVDAAAVRRLAGHADAARR